MTQATNNPVGVAVKWVIILAFTALASSPRHPMRLCAMDVTAVAALASMLTASLTLTAIILMAVTNELLSPLLKRYGKGAAYPFLPVVWTVTTLIVTAKATGLL